MWPQLLIATLFALNIGVTLASRGKLTRVVVWPAVARAATLAFLLHMGGFW